VLHFGRISVAIIICALRPYFELVSDEKAEIVKIRHKSISIIYPSTTIVFLAIVSVTGIAQCVVPAVAQRAQEAPQVTKLQNNLVSTKTCINYGVNFLLKCNIFLLL
jgi:hypothetical protein